MQEKMYGEQPDLAEISGAAAQEDFGNADANGGSPLGKFKDANSLLTAYNNLQSEFTKKCQMLSKLQSSQQDDNTSSTLQDVPCYVREDWQNTICEFMNNHNFAKKFSKEIAEEIVMDKVLANMPNSLDIAYARVLEKHIKDDETVNKEDVIKQVLNSNSGLKEDIVQEYLNKLNKTPALMSHNRGGAVGLSPFETPKNMKEAGEMAKKLFK